jgi:CRP/FNR family transcriptional regulator, anaerobic regulatory protein
MTSKTISPALLTTVPPRCVNCRLRRTENFLPVQPETIDFIENFRRTTTLLDAGVTIIHEQQPNGKLFTLYSGWAFRYKSLSDGRRQILNFLLPGDLVGLQQEFSETAMHGVEAVTDVSLCAFPRDGLWDLFRKHPELGYDITWLSARGEGFVDDHLLTTGRRNATERIAMLLMHLYRRLQYLGLEEKDADGKGVSVEWPINQQHIADTLGLSLVHTNKTLRRLHQLGLHDIENSRLRLVNPKALERVADYYEKPRRPVPLL